MKKVYLVFAVVFALYVGQASAQNWKDMLGKVVETVTSGDESGNSEAGVLGNILGNILGSSVELTEESMEGSWKYSGIACVLESQNALSSIGGTFVSDKLEDTMDGALAKFGVVPGSCEFTFNKDRSCVVTLGGKNVMGTYSIVPEEKKIDFTFLLGQVKVSAFLARSGSDVNIVFEADKVLQLLKTVSASLPAGSGEGNSAISTGIGLANTLLGAYDGMMIGVKMSRSGDATTVTGGQQVETKVETADKAAEETKEEPKSKCFLKKLFGL